MDSIEQCGKILSIKELAPKAEEISRNLKEKYEYAADRLGAFAIAKNGIRCCCDRHLMYVTDLQFHPLLAYESSSFMTQWRHIRKCKIYSFSNGEESGRRR